MNAAPADEACVQGDIMRAAAVTLPHATGAARLAFDCNNKGDSA
jgi:hypothetical protein